MNQLGKVATLGRSLIRSRAITTSASLLHPRTINTNTPRFVSRTLLSRPSNYAYIPSVTIKRPFHVSRPSQVPLIPFAGLLAGLAKSTSIVNIISFTSKTSLTFLPYHLRRGKGASMLLALVMIPLVGSGLLVTVGLDKAPNTSRLRLIYMSKEEEESAMDDGIAYLKIIWGTDRRGDDEQISLWVKEIVDDLAKVTVDDVRSPVREYKEDEAKVDYDVHVVDDGVTLNALCLGRSIVIYERMIMAMDYNPDKLAAILAHELGHHLQRHYAEKIGMESLLYSIVDMARGFFWMFTEPLGPYINENINKYMIQLVDAEVNTAYSRPLETEADLIGLRIMAKAGFDPRAAIEVWEKMDEITKELENEESADDEEWTLGNFESRLQTYLDSMYNSWFGSTHPYCSVRAQNMRDHMDEAVALYEESIKLNGSPEILSFEWADAAEKEEEVEEEEVVESNVEKGSEGYFDRIKSIFTTNPAAVMIR